MWTFVGCKTHKAWRWLTVERASRRIVAWVPPCPGVTTATATTIPTSGKPTLRFCPVNITDPDQQAVEIPALSKSSLVLYASAVASWCVNSVPSAKVC